MSGVLFGAFEPHFGSPRGAQVLKRESIVTPKRPRDAQEMIQRRPRAPQRCSWGSSRGSWSSFWRPREPFGVLRASIWRVPGRFMDARVQFSSNFAEYSKTIGKPRFFFGFSWFLGVRRAANSMKMEPRWSKVEPGTQKNRP